MGFQIRQLRLRVETPSGPFGADIEFFAGLNILRAPNTSGKSTSVQAILYALGLEGMLGPGREVPLPHAMTHRLEDHDGREIDVLESHVLLEIVGAMGQHLTIRRYVKHSSIDTNLVSVWDGSISAAADRSSARQRDFYVRRPGAAQREAGFHHFLANQLGWELPQVPRFSGGSSPLYLETIAPLWFVEQKRGWTGIQAQTPSHLQIRDVRRRALEFTLNLNIQERARRIEELEESRRTITSAWIGQIAKIETEAAELGVSIESLPSRPSIGWSPSITPQLQIVSTTGEWQSLDARLRAMRDEHSAYVENETPGGRCGSELEQQMDATVGELQHLNVLGNENGRRLELERLTASDARERLEAVDEDIQRHKDLLVLESMGSTLEPLTAIHDCPTCHKPLNGVLMHPEDVPPVLAAEASVELLQQQRSLLEELATDAERLVRVRMSKATALRATAAALRSSIRAIRESLVAPADYPSIEQVERRLTLRRQIERMAEFRDAWLDSLERLSGLSQSWTEATLELRALRGGEFSQEDRDKLTTLEHLFQVELAAYGFQSCPVDQVALSLDDYMPTHEGFEMSFDFSASDGIRVIWAYLMSLLRLSDEAETNHPGLLVFDEPRQQAAADISFSALLARAASVGGDSQVVFATSEDASVLDEMIDGLSVNVQQFDAKIIHRL